MELINEYEISKNSILEEIKNGKKNFLLPICNEIAYLDCKIINNDKFKIHVGNGIFVEKNLEQTIEYSKEKIKKNIEKKNCLKKLDSKTFQIIEHEIEEDLKKIKINENKNENKNDKEKEKIFENNNKIKEELLNFNPIKNNNKNFIEVKLKNKEDIIKFVYDKIYNKNNYK